MEKNLGTRAEIGRKFLVSDAPPIARGHTALAGDGTEVRVRRAGDRHSLALDGAPRR